MRIDFGVFLLFVLALSQGADAFPLSGELSKGGSGGGGGGGGGGGSSGGSRGGSRGGSSGGSGSSSGRGGSRGASTGRGGSGDTGKPAVRTTGVGGRLANFFSGGGGKAIILGAGAYFVGRKMGGGLREQIVGTPRYASGYPYSNGNVMTSGVRGQPFPFGFWPIYWGYHGYGGEYIGGEGHAPNTTVTDQRPGGELVYVKLVPFKGSRYDWNGIRPDVNDTYYMIGDTESVVAMMSLLTDPPADSAGGKPFGCGAQNNPILPFVTINPDGSPLLYPNTTTANTTSTGTNTISTASGNNNTTTLPIRFENVMTWYRASSFAIAYENYTNIFALSPLNDTTAVDSWTNSSPFPTHQTVSSFLGCVNRTIMAALPILDAEQKILTAAQIAGIVIGSIAGAVLIGVAAWFTWKWAKKQGEPPKKKGQKQKKQEKKQKKQKKGNKQQEQKYEPVALKEKDLSDDEKASEKK
ncbi:hypothetical protein FRC17_001145 [Serendipita sp. 399]|nr:hypothetical protein FRC17_001145 [Serendipita sp. 399]